MPRAEAGAPKSFAVYLDGYGHERQTNPPPRGVGSLSGPGLGAAVKKHGPKIVADSIRRLADVRERERPTRAGKPSTAEERASAEAEAALDALGKPRVTEHPSWGLLADPAELRAWAAGIERAAAGETDVETCPKCGAKPDDRGVLTHINPTDEQRERAAREGVPVGVVQERDLQGKAGRYAAQRTEPAQGREHAQMVLFDAIDAVDRGDHLHAANVLRTVDPRPDGFDDLLEGTETAAKTGKSGKVRKALAKLEALGWHTERS